MKKIFPDCVIIALSAAEIVFMFSKLFEIKTYFELNPDLFEVEGTVMKIGSKVKNKICPTMIGVIKKICGNDTAIIEITDKYLSIKELMICTENWEEVE